MKNETQLTLAVGTAFKVDREKGTLRNLSLMKAGREAKGHGIYIDDRTLQTALAVVGERGGLLKAYYTHDHVGSGIAGGSHLYSPESELKIPGFFSGIKVVDGELVAEKFELFETFRRHHPEEADQIMEMAEKTPQLLALSVEIWGYGVFVAEDGSEYSQAPEDVDLLHDGLPTLRITELFAAAFVADGAATDGLFAQMSRRLKTALVALAANDNKGKNQTSTLTAANNATNANSAKPHHMKIIDTLKEKFGTGTAAFRRAMGLYGENPEQPVETIVETVAASLAADEAAAAAAAAEEEAPETDPELETIEALRQIFADDKPAFHAAMGIFGEDPTQTAVAVAERLAAQKTEETLSALRASLTEKETVIKALQAENEKQTQAAAHWKNQFGLIRNSGHISQADAQALGVDLGLPASGEHGQPNPWSPGAINFTAQAEISSRSPELAQSLKAAALSHA